MSLTLKRGSGRTFNGSNWQSVSDKTWEVQVLFIPGSPAPKEEYLGNRLIDGTDFAVFKCLNDDFMAQPVSICELPLPKDQYSTSVFYSLEAPVPEERKMTNSNNSVQSTKVLMFSGKNWKLASDKKWKSSSSFATHDAGNKVGEKTIGTVLHDIFRVPDGFAAIKQGE